jgi:hypothetical protein
MPRPRKQRPAACEICDRRRKLNRFGLCKECAQAEDHTASGGDAQAVFTASHSLSDILPYVDKNLDEPRDWHGRNK